MAVGRAEFIVGVVGAGAMGSGIAQSFASSGHETLLWDCEPGAAEEAKSKTAEALAKLVSKGKLSEAERRGTLDRIRTAKDLGEFKGIGLLVEAIVEDTCAKRELFQRLEGILRVDAIIATNTSSLSVTELGAGLKCPERFAGLHFFNPAPIMPLVEVVRGARTDSDVVERLAQVVEAMGKTPVRVRSAPGFIVNKGARAFYGESLRVLEEGAADAATIDALIRAAGFRMGPLELIDYVGLDVNLAVSRSMMEAYHNDPRYAPSRVVEELVAGGCLGRKSGSGFYDHGSETKPESAVFAECKAPDSITVFGGLGPADGLIPLLEAKGVHVTRKLGFGSIEVGFAKLELTHGHLSVEPPAPGMGGVLFDLALDYATADHIALAPGPGCGERAIKDAVGLFQILGKKVSVVENTPGLVVARTLCMLINEAFDTRLRGTASAADIDLAMRLGLNFPGGPFEWVERLGAAYCLKVLDCMRFAYGEERYRACVALRRAAIEEIESATHV